MNAKKISAGIVTYFPNLERLDENVNSIIKQVDCVIIFDNGSDNQAEIIKHYDKKVMVIPSDKNVGIARALNELMRKGDELGYSWMITLDQDSVCPDDYCQKMIPYLNIENNLGIVAPVIMDRNIGVVGHKPYGKYKSVKTCITSGAFTNIAVWREVDGFDDTMFIDSVDFEYCYRVRRAGYQIIQIKDVTLLHELGNSMKKKIMFWNINIYRHSAFRKYYIAKNNIYYPLKHKLWLYLLRGNIRNIMMICTTAIFEKQKLDKIKKICSGWRDGYRSVRSKK